MTPMEFIDARIAEAGHKGLKMVEVDLYMMSIEQLTSMIEELKKAGLKTEIGKLRLQIDLEPEKASGGSDAKTV